jgi:pimeloyl-ACP methyl ester carboxylesterase
LTNTNTHILNWNGLDVAWKKQGGLMNSQLATLLIHGFGANKDHWRHNQAVLGSISECYAIDLIGFGESSQPDSCIQGERKSPNNFCYNFDNWGQQIADFTRLVIKKPVILIGNSIGGIIALRAAKILGTTCKGIILINCAQRLMDDKQLAKQSFFQKGLRPFLKFFTRQRWLSKNLFRNAAKPNFIEKVLKKAYPSGSNIDEDLINLLYQPTKGLGAPEAFHGFINIFNDYLAPELMKQLDIPVNMICGEKDPWEPISEAKDWFSYIECIRSLEIIPNSGHCPHDETPELVNPILLKLIQDAT